MRHVSLVVDTSSAVACWELKLHMQHAVPYMCVSCVLRLFTFCSLCSAALAAQHALSRSLLCSNLLVASPLYVLVLAEALHMQHAVPHLVFCACWIAVLFVLLFQQHGVPSHILFCIWAFSLLIEGCRTRFCQHVLWLNSQVVIIPISQVTKYCVTCMIAIFR